MSKVIEQLLKLTFPNANINALMEVIYATPNQEVATELLCGLYSEPEVVHKSIVYDKIPRHFIGYDKWNKAVQYEYNDPITKDAYFPKGTLKDTITLENFDSLKQSWQSDKDQVHISIPTGEFRKRTSSMDLETWNKQPEYISPAKVKQLEAENIYA